MDVLWSSIAVYKESKQKRFAQVASIPLFFGAPAFALIM